MIVMILKSNFEGIDWRKRLTRMQYHVLREKGTEPPFSGDYVYFNKKGIYECVGCGNKLFSSEEKFDSKSGWPSFSKPLKKDVIIKKLDNRYGIDRIEVLCSLCGGHLGHVFNDGPQPTCKRYCINSNALRFREKMD